MSDDTERILNPGKFTSAEPFKETAIHQAKERVIEAVRKWVNGTATEAEINCKSLVVALKALDEAEQEPTGRRGK